MPLFGAAYAAPNKSTTILYRFRSPKTLLNPPVNGKIQGLFKAFECFQVLSKANLVFKAFIRQSCIFKYFSSLCEPCLTISSFKIYRQNNHSPLIMIIHDRQNTHWKKENHTVNIMNYSSTAFGTNSGFDNPQCRVKSTKIVSMIRKYHNPDNKPVRHQWTYVITFPWPYWKSSLMCLHICFIYIDMWLMWYK